jgi:hypothetical protein
VLKAPTGRLLMVGLCCRVGSNHRVAPRVAPKINYAKGQQYNISIAAHSTLAHDKLRHLERLKAPIFATESPEGPHQLAKSMP